MSLPKKITSTIIKLTVANGETVHPGKKIELIESDFNILFSSGKVKKYEAGDEEKYTVKETKKVSDKK